MTIAIGIAITDHIVAGRIEDQRITGNLLRYPDNADDMDALTAIPGRELVQMMAAQIGTLISDAVGTVEAIGVAAPGIIRHGVVEDSPNLSQTKGMRLAAALTLQCISPTMPTRLRLVWPRSVGNSTNLLACGQSAKALAMAAGLTPRAFGRVGTSRSHWTPKRDTAPAAELAIWRESWATERCA